MYSVSNLFYHQMVKMQLLFIVTTSCSWQFFVLNLIVADICQLCVKTLIWLNISLGWDCSNIRSQRCHIFTDKELIFHLHIFKPELASNKKYEIKLLTQSCQICQNKFWIVFEETHFFDMFLWIHVNVQDLSKYQYHIKVELEPSFH